jgi:uncharacterized SAM-binding protein YcdF (DUF218 family)
MRWDLEKMKSLVNLLLWFLLLQTAGLYWLRRGLSARSRIVLWSLLFSSILLGIASTPLAWRGLEASLQVASSPDSAIAPAYIFVLGGGYLPGSILEEDALVMESQRRVLHAVTLWRQFPNARIVLSGAAHEYEGIRDPDRLAQLMADVAMSRRVPTSAILLEPRSINTREHPIEALKLPGVTPITPIGVVTSDWHMRRAEQEFRRYFQQVYTYPVPPLRDTQGLQSLMPAAGSLGANTILLQEWVGILWYKLLSLKT